MRGVKGRARKFSVREARLVERVREALARDET